ncbi:MAG: hypothetical protein WEC15_04375 [Flavobacteriales bacterium]
MPNAEHMTRTGGIQMVDGVRAQFDGTATEHDFREVAGQPGLQTLQCAVPVPDEMWTMVNDVFCTARPDVEIRVYGFNGYACDLHFLRHLTHVRRASLDGLMRVKRLETIAAMTRLESLRLGISELSDLSILERIPAELTSLSLEATRSKKASLAVLCRFRSLRALYLEGHHKDIEVLSELTQLEDLTLRSITTEDLSYLEPLPNLWSLDIKLGGIRNFNGIEGKESIKYLELWQVRDLAEVGIVGRLPGLQNLFLQSLPQVTAFPDLQEAGSLRRVVVENMKGLSDFSALQAAPVLEEFVLTDGKKQTPQQLLPVLKNPALRRIDAVFGSDKKDKEFERLREEYGKESHTWEAFTYC